MKECNKCNIYKDLSEFSKNKGTKDGLLNECKLCRKNYSALIYKNNKTIILKKSKEYYEFHRDERLIKIKLYDTLNKNKKNKYILEWSSKKLQNNPEFKLLFTIRDRIGKALKNKNYHSIEYLGCSIKEYKLYLESLFLSVFTWKNHGKIWEIDHKIPLSSFDLSQEENIYKAFNYQNTQPIFKTTEIAKSFGYLNEIGNRNKGAKII